jgi:hypothetical protein
MAQFSYDHFIHALKILASYYPQYTYILEQLIAELEQDKIASIQHSLEKDSDW